VTAVIASDTTKGELVDSAYTEIGLAGYIVDISPEEQQTALRRLERMMAMWDARGIRIGYNLAGMNATLNDLTGAPDWSEDPIITNLALRLAPTLGKQVSIDTRKAAREGYTTLCMGNYEIPNMQMPRHMPIGLGNRRNTKNQQFFAPVDRVTTTHDGILEPNYYPLSWDSSS
jgi:hypothetical protein